MLTMGTNGVRRIVAMKYHIVESAKRVVDIAMDMSGGAGMYKGNELERLYRDVRAGGFHPANSALVHELVGKTTLGVGLEEFSSLGLKPNRQLLSCPVLAACVSRHLLYGNDRSCW